MNNYIELAILLGIVFVVALVMAYVEAKSRPKQTPPTWNDAINAMSAEEKAKWMQVYGSHFHDIARAYAYKCSINQDRTFDGAYREKMTELLNSPYDGWESAGRSGMMDTFKLDYEMRFKEDSELYLIAIEKRKNGNGTPRAYAAQRELARRNAPYRLRGYRNGSSKRYSYNEDYMGFEQDNR